MYEFSFLDCPLIPISSLGSITDPNKVRCHLRSGCDYMSCCVYMTEVKRHVRVDLGLDVCNHTLSGSIDNLAVSTDLMDYNWGEFKVFKMDPFENIALCNFFSYDICGMGINFFFKVL